MENQNVNRWSAYNEMVHNLKIKNKIKIDNWSDYFNYINMKLGIEISDEMKMDLLRNDIKKDILKNLH